MIGKVTRQENGTWVNHDGKGVFMGEDAKILDVMFGYKQTPKQRKKALEDKFDKDMAVKE